MLNTRYVIRYVRYVRYVDMLHMLDIHRYVPGPELTKFLECTDVWVSV